MRYYCIADFKVEVDGIEAYPYAESRFADYETEAFDCADVKIKLEDVDFIQVPKQKPLASSYLLRRYYKDSDSYDIYLVEDEGNGAVAQIHSNLTWSELTVKTSSVHITGIETDFLAFRFLFDAFKNIIAYAGGIVLHSSAISYKNQGILFSAPSGTGKSTHTGLWQRLWPESVEVVNDDTPAIFFKNNVPYMYGLPWSGKGPNKNMSVPLKSVVFLQRSEQNVIKLSDTDSAVFYLLEQTYKSVYIDNLDKILQQTERLIDYADIYVIGVNMCDDAAVMVRNTVFKD
jgi:hypothetical protein